ncbi:MAG: hypothetical protein HY711_06690 [Candidatus Melainabacteria bacterium]|nr:hypothetical protein [Candidatus Melainabacteria bacterium]
MSQQNNPKDPQASGEEQSPQSVPEAFQSDARRSMKQFAEGTRRYYESRRLGMRDKFTYELLPPKPELFDSEKLEKKKQKATSEVVQPASTSKRRKTKTRSRTAQRGVQTQAQMVSPTVPTAVSDALVSDTSQTNKPVNKSAVREHDELQGLFHQLKTIINESAVVSKVPVLEGELAYKHSSKADYHKRMIQVISTLSQQFGWQSQAVVDARKYIASINKA